MTVKEFKDFIQDCQDNDYITFCISRDDNPISDACEVGMVYKINANSDNLTQVCLMPQ